RLRFRFCGAPARASGWRGEGRNRFFLEQSRKWLRGSEVSQQRNFSGSAAHQQALAVHLDERQKALLPQRDCLFQSQPPGARPRLLLPHDPLPTGCHEIPGAPQRPRGLREGTCWEPHQRAGGRAAIDVKNTLRHERSVRRTARRSPATSNSVQPTSCPLTRKGRSLLWWYPVSTIEPFDKRSRSRTVNRDTGRSTASVHGSHGNTSPGSRSCGFSSNRVTCSTSGCGTPGWLTVFMRLPCLSNTWHERHGS